MNCMDRKVALPNLITARCHEAVSFGTASEGSTLQGLVSFVGVMVGVVLAKNL